MSVLTTSTSVNHAPSSQVITFYLSDSQVDQVTFSGNQFTFSAIDSFTLSKEDTMIYLNYLQVFQKTVTINFSESNGLYNQPLPACEYDIDIVNSDGDMQLTYIQTSGGTSIYNISYDQNSQTATFSSRSQISITSQEFAASVKILNLFAIQVGFN